MYNGCKMVLYIVTLFFIVVEETEATVVIKQEKVDELPVVPEHEKILQSCFCPHGYTTSTLGHYHCRYCGHSSRYKQNVLKHEKVHKHFLPDEAAPPNQRYYSCRQCGFLSRYAKNLWEHERNKHARLRPATNKNVSQSHSKTTAVGTGVMLETTANRLRAPVSNERHFTEQLASLLYCWCACYWHSLASVRDQRPFSSMVMDEERIAGWGHCFLFPLLLDICACFHCHATYDNVAHCIALQCVTIQHIT